MSDSRSDLDALAALESIGRQSPGKLDLTPPHQAVEAMRERYLWARRQYNFDMQQGQGGCGMAFTGGVLSTMTCVFEWLGMELPEDVAEDENGGLG